VSSPPNGVSGAGGTSGALTLTITPSSPQQLVVSSISPTSAVAGGPGFTLTVNGSGFVPPSQNSAGSQVTFNLVHAATTFVSPTQLTAFVLASEISVAGNPYVIVTNPNGLASAPINFVIAFPQPGGGTVTPPSVPAGANALLLTVTGTGFVSASVVLVNGNPRTTTFVNSTTLQAMLVASDLDSAGTLNITVVNPAPGGGTTPALHFAVTDYSLTLTAPSSPVPAGQSAIFQLTLAPQNGAFPNLVTFSTSPLPTGTTASFSPSASMTPGNAPATVTLSIATTSRSADATKDRRTPVEGAPSAETLSTLICCVVGLLLLRSRHELPRQARILGVRAGDVVHGGVLRIAGCLALVALGGLYSIQSGCGYAASPASYSSSGTSTPTQNPAVNIAGSWSFATTSSKFSTQTTITGTIAQSGSAISGPLNIQGSPCAEAASLSGSVDGADVTASIVESGQAVTLTGTVAPDANTASGTYSTPAGGCLNGDTGKWTGSRAAPVTNPNGTPSGSYPIKVTATSGGLSHSTTVMLTVM
jgi:trimeric autotransporter adhesin